MYEVNSDLPAVQALVSGETLTDTVTVTSLDGTFLQDITIAINGNNPAVIGGSVTHNSVKEDVAVDANGDLVASGQLSITDVDARGVLQRWDDCRRAWLANDYAGW